MINQFRGEETSARPEFRGERDDPNKRVIMTRDEENYDSIAYALPDEDEFALDALSDDDFLDFDDEVYRAADEELSIVDAMDIGIGYGLDEKELAQLTGRPD